MLRKLIAVLLGASLAASSFSAVFAEDGAAGIPLEENGAAQTGVTRTEPGGAENTENEETPEGTKAPEETKTPEAPEAVNITAVPTERPPRQGVLSDIAESEAAVLAENRSWSSNDSFDTSSGNGSWGEVWQAETFNPKPCLAIWEKYTKDEWWTNTGAKSDENGSAAMRGHRGNYDITVTVNGKTAKTTLVVSDTGENNVNAVVKSDGTIELASSEEVNRRERTRRNYLMEGRTSEYELTHMWEKLYENKLTDIKFSDGTELDFLAGENGGSHSVKPGEYITASVEEPIENGYVSVTIPDSKTLGVCSVYGSGDGTQWEFIGNFGSGDDKYIGFNGTYKSFKITPTNDKKTTITNIHVSRKEPNL